MNSTEETEPGALSFDEALGQLQQVVRTLESGELSLEDALKAFERGVGLSRACQRLLTVAEQKIEILVRGGEGSTEPELAPFDSNEARKAKT
ncbi:MAG: exodeoxyribonuclease VII small subunit [Oligoflexia bacterium]